MSDKQLELIIYRLDEIAADQSSITEEQKCLKKEFNRLSLQVEHRVTKLETKASVRGAISGAITTILMALSAGILWLVNR